MLDSPRLRDFVFWTAVAILLMPASPYDSVSEEIREEKPDQRFSHSSGSIDTPSWKINDRWVYDGELDVYDFIASSGVSTNVNTLTGTLDVQVTDVLEIDIGGVQTIAYEATGQGDYRADNIQLEGQNGDVIVEMETVSLIRASDMAVISQTATIDIEFDGPWWVCLLINCNIASITAANEYWPPLERHDFPLYVGDSWVNNYTVNTTYSGTSAYVDIPQDSSEQVETTSTVVQAGYPGVSHSGCAVSYNVTATDVNGSIVGYGWHCDSIGNDVLTLNEVTLGLMAEHEIQSSNLAFRSTEVHVGLGYPLSPFNLESPIWVNVTDSSGTPLQDTDVEVSYDATGFGTTVTTASNGSAFLSLDYGAYGDDSYVVGEYGSHGILARVGTDDIGVSTVTLDPDIHEVDLKLESVSISVERNRSDTIETIPSPYDAVPGDIVTISVPIVNDGLMQAPPGFVEAFGSNTGTIGSESFPSLPSLGTSVANFEWTVPEIMGNELISFSIDTGESDGNPSNDAADIFVYVGRLPYADVSIPSDPLTLTDVIIDATASNDPDGGEVTCKIESQMPDGTVQSAIGCTHSQAWSDDGQYNVTVTITDDEGDISQVSTTVNILNRPPEATLLPYDSSIVIGDQITLQLENVRDLDTNTPTSPVGISWNESCIEGTLGVSCTFTPSQEGDVVASVTIVDDDGAQTTINANILVLNAPPVLESIQVWFGPNRLSQDSRGLYTVNEGDLLRFTAAASDSPGDMPTLYAIWRPDADSSSGPIVEDYSPDFVTEYVYTTSGFHLLAIEIFDDDGASTGITTVPIEVINTPPTIDPVSPPLPVFEDSPLTISVSVRDTPSDLENIEICWDLDLTIDTSASGSVDDDCDYTGSNFDYTWGDSNSAPSSIILHISDDDGATASVEIPITVRNKAPVALGVISEESPVEGDTVILSAQGSSDTPYDFPNLDYAWDLDIMSDTDGDGDPGNDRDLIGYSTQTTFNNEGTRVVRLIVSDGTESSFWDVEVSVNPAPQPFGMIAASIGVLVVVALAVTIILRGRGKGPNEPVLKTRDTSTEIIRPSKPIPIEKEIVNEDPIRESMEDLAEKLYGSQASAPTSRSDDDISAISSSLREALMEEDSS
ncbi:MAG: hypothetical protein CMB07_01615 [Euryarchaeota archaeon]|nr:hypothetical protein [Euryarchaeota archaeon]